MRQLGGVVVIGELLDGEEGQTLRLQIDTVVLNTGGPQFAGQAGPDFVVATLVLGLIACFQLHGKCSTFHSPVSINGDRESRTWTKFAGACTVFGVAWQSSFIRYLVVNDAARAWQIYCTDCGCMETEAGVPYPPNPDKHPPQYRKNLTTTGRVLGEFQLVYITRGGGIFESAESERQTVTAGDCLLLFPGVWHAYRPDPATGWDEYWVGFSGEHPHRLAQADVISPLHPLLHPGRSQSLIDHFIRLFEIAIGEAPGFQLELGAQTLVVLAAMLAGCRRDGVQDDSVQVVEQAKAAMGEQLAGDLELESLTRSLNMSYSSLLSHFKRYTGLTPYQYFLQLKVHHAKHLLRDGTVSIKEVAWQLGFEDQFYFSRLFKKKTGVSPSLWQKGEAGES